ncbi:MAG: hypothetical protein GC171_14775 [Terrimonas sp.]|nr:hypothetical protein [Terrimonas sp.]
MRWLLFLSRLAFICNIFFLLSFSLKLHDWIGQEALTSTIIILGFVLSILFNPATVFSYLFVFIFNRKKLELIPVWLVITNVIFLFLQLTFLLLLNIEPTP